MVEDYGREIKWEGNPDSGWILMDYGEVLVNVMTESAREYYDLESLWANGEPIPLEGQALFSIFFPQYFLNWPMELFGVRYFSHYFLWLHLHLPYQY